MGREGAIAELGIAEMQAADAGYSFSATVAEAIRFATRAFGSLGSRSC